MDPNPFRRRAERARQAGRDDEADLFDGFAEASDEGFRKGLEDGERLYPDR